MSISGIRIVSSIKFIPGVSYRLERTFEELCVLGKEKPILCSNCINMQIIDNKYKCKKFKLTAKKVKTLQDFLMCKEFTPFGYAK